MMKLFLSILFLLAVTVLDAQLSLDWYKNSDECSVFNSKESIYNYNDSCIYTIGAFSGQFEFDGISISTIFPKAFFLMKTSKDGGIVWLKKIVEADYQIESTYDVAINADVTGKIVLGITSNGVLYHGVDSTRLSTNSSATGSVLFKMDTSGIELWHRKLFVSTLKSICMDQNNIIYSTGRSLNGDVFLMATAPDSDSLWSRFGGSSSGEDIGENVITDDDMNIYLTGVIQPNNSVYFDSFHPTFVSPYFNGSFLAKYDSNGNIQWVRCFYAPDFGEMVWIRSLSILEDKIMLGGEFSGGVVKFFPVSSILNSQNAMNTGSVLLCYDTSGNKIWAREHYNNFAGECSIGKIVNENNRFWILTEYTGSVSVDGGDTIIALGNSDLCMDIVDLNGNSVWYYQLGGSNFDGATSFFKIENDLVLNISTKSTSLQADNATMTLASVSNQMVLVRFNYETLGLSENTENDFSIFPNPTNGKWSIQAIKDLSGNTLQVFSVAGELIYEQVMSSGCIHQINEQFPSGIYLVRIAELSEKPFRLVIN